MTHQLIGVLLFVLLIAGVEMMWSKRRRYRKKGKKMKSLDQGFELLEISPGKPYVYTLAKPNGVVFYIGKGTNRRIYDHEWEATLDDSRQYNTYKSRIIRKIWRDGGQVSKNILAHFDTDQEAYEYESALIFGMRPYSHLANKTDGGDGARGLMVSEETRRKLSKANKGRPSNRKGVVLGEETRRKLSKAATNISEETRRKISESSKLRSASKETRRKMSEARKGRIVSKETRRRISEANKGRVYSEEVRLKMSEAQKGNSNHLGKKHSEETKRKISEAARNISEETRRKMSEANKGRKHTEEARRKISEAGKGRVFSEETRRKISEANNKRRRKE